MLRIGRLLDAASPRRVVAFLLLAGFAQEIFSALSWAASLAWSLSGVPALRSLLRATVELGLEAALIYLALRGLGSLLERRRRGRATADVETTASGADMRASPDELGGPGPRGRAGRGKGAAMASVPTASDRASTPREGGLAAVGSAQGGGAEGSTAVEGVRTMSPRCESANAVAIGGQPVAELGRTTFARLVRVSGPATPPPVACLRVRERDLVICDGGGAVLYSLRMTGRTAGWGQRAVFYPPAAELQALVEHPSWARRARRLCLTSTQARACRVPVGVVAAEARAAEELGDLENGEETVLRLSEAAAAVLQTGGKQPAKAGRLLMVDVERARRPSHVPLHRLQGALAVELALGRSVAAICSRSPGFSDSTEESKVGSLLYRRLGLQGTRDRGSLRYARVASAEAAALLCEVLDLAPEQVGL
jgi:hypothetical protein